MDKYSLTRRADNDLVDIAEYTIKEFGIKQARRYRDAMELCFLTLTENPYIGQDAKEFAPDLRCFEHRSHLIFYLPQASDILIVRILHKLMDVSKHL